MKSLHLKSPCCQGRIYHHGGKRRVCSQCGQTWTVRPKKRGPKPIRRFLSPVYQVLNGITLTAWARRRHINVATASEQFQQHLVRFTRRPLKLTLPQGPCCILADALWFTFRNQDWILFLLALKPVSEPKAYFLDPVLLSGGESYENWMKALSAIPPHLKQCIKAFVSDGFRVSRRIASEHGWIHQRCHFHLIAYLQLRRGRRKNVIAGKSVREAIFQTVVKLLRIKSRASVIQLSRRLKRFARKPDCPKSLRMTVAEFLRALPEFRAYLDYPELRLPTTTGSIETMCKLVRKRVGTVKTVQALQRWATAIVRIKSPLTCNGKEH